MAALPTHRILLVEDDELFRLGLRTRLEREPGFQVVAEAEDGETALEIAKAQPLNVVVLDIGLPGIGGVEACRQIRRECPSLPVLVLTSHPEKSLVSRLIEGGAQGYCLKGVPARTLILAIYSVAAGASWWHASATTQIRAAFDQGPRGADPPRVVDLPLTKREQEILGLIAKGKTNQEIARALYISPGTVRVHVHFILQKLAVKDRTQAAVLALKHLEGPPPPEA